MGCNYVSMIAQNGSLFTLMRCYHFEIGNNCGLQLPALSSIKIGPTSITHITTHHNPGKRYHPCVRNHLLSTLCIRPAKQTSRRDIQSLIVTPFTRLTILKKRKTA